jgi:hypothetical protein
MEALIQWIYNTWPSHFANDYRWTWPIAESIHFFGLVLLAGTVGAFDLRLLGVARGIPPLALHRLLRFGIAGFGVSVITGLLFISGAPDQYFYNYAFYFKSACLFLMGLNVILFYSYGYQRVRELGPEDVPPPAVRAIAAVSLLLLTGVMLGGRMLTFFRPPAFY